MCVHSGNPPPVVSAEDWLSWAGTQWGAGGAISGAIVKTLPHSQALNNDKALMDTVQWASHRLAFLIFTRAA